MSLSLVPLLVIRRFVLKGGSFRCVLLHKKIVKIANVVLSGLLNLKTWIVSLAYFFGEQIDSNIAS